MPLLIDAKKFDFYAVFIAAMQAGLSTGFAPNLEMEKIAGKFAMTREAFFKVFKEGLLSGIETGLAIQAVELITGKEKHFNWKELVACALNQTVNSLVLKLDPQNLYGDIGRKVITQFSDELTRDLLNQRHMDVELFAARLLGSIIGEVISNKVQRFMDENKKSDEDNIKKQTGTEDLKTKSEKNTEKSFKLKDEDNYDPNLLDKSINVIGNPESYGFKKSQFNNSTFFGNKVKQQKSDVYLKNQKQIQYVKDDSEISASYINAWNTYNAQQISNSDSALSKIKYWSYGIGQAFESDFIDLAKNTYQSLTDPLTPWRILNKFGNALTNPYLINEFAMDLSQSAYNLYDVEYSWMKSFIANPKLAIQGLENEFINGWNNLTPEKVGHGLFKVAGIGLMLATEGLGNAFEALAETKMLGKISDSVRFFKVEKSGAKVLNFGAEEGFGFTSRLNRAQLKDYLSNVHEISREQLIKDIESVGFTLKDESPTGLFKVFEDDAGKLRIKIHPPDNRSNYSHVHLYDKAGNSLTSNLTHAPHKSPEVHIRIEPIQEELDWRLMK